MKLQNKRLIIQLLALVLTAVGFFISFQVVLGIIVLTGLFAGVFYCGWICPFGTLQDLMSKLGRKLGIKKYKMPIAIQKYLKYSRYIFAIMFTLLTFDFIFSLTSLDPRNNFISFLTSRSISYLSLLVITSFLAIALFFDRPFCNYFCMEGAKYGAMSSLRAFTIVRDEDTCVSCNKCNKVCPMNIEISTKGQVASTQCINCFECVSACPVEDTLMFQKRSFTKLYKNILAGALFIAIVAGGYLAFTRLTSETEATDYLYDQNRYGQTEEAVSVDETESNDSLSNNDLTKAVETVATGNYTDGRYEGTGMGFRGQMTVEVTIENGEIADVIVTEHQDDRKWYNRAKDLLDIIVSEQSADIDTISGATYSSQGIIEGAKNALEKAKE